MHHSAAARLASAWDAEYAAGRYRSEPPVAFVQDIVRASRDAGLVGSEGLYVGCGNGRSYVPLVAAGLDLVGLDISSTAIEQLAARVPERRERLVHGGLAALPATDRYSLVIRTSTGSDPEAGLEGPLSR